MQWAEQYLSNNKADPSHSLSLSFKNCMLRVPGSHNSESVMKNNGIADSSTEVRIVQRWNGFKPAINWLLYDFRHYLIQEKTDAVLDTRNKLKRRFSRHHHHGWPW